jgi:hypothetical protein
MDSKIKDIIFITNYLTNCKLEDPNSEKSELTRKLLTCRVRQILNERSKKITKLSEKNVKRGLFSYLFYLLYITL